MRVERPFFIYLAVAIILLALCILFIYIGGEFFSALALLFFISTACVIYVGCYTHIYISSSSRKKKPSAPSSSTIQEGHTQPSKPSTEYEKPKANPYGELYGKIYEHIYSSVGYICENETAKLEISTYCIFLFDILSFITKHDRNFIQKSVLQYIKSNYRDLFDSSIKLYDVRVTLYSNIFNRQIRVLRAFSYRNNTMAEKDPVYASFIALCDILWNPDCALDYENSLIKRRDIREVLAFDDKVKQAYISILEEINKSGLFRRPTMKP